MKYHSSPFIWIFFIFFWVLFRYNWHTALYTFKGIPGGAREGNGTPLQCSCLENAWTAAVYGVAKSQTRLSDFTFAFHFHALEKEMATHSTVLAWSNPGMTEPGGLLSMGSHRVGHSWSDLAAAATAVKAMVFPVVMYGCESWTIKKAECQELMLLNCGVGEDSWESLGLQGDPTSPF